MNLKTLTISSCVAIATIALFADAAQAQSRGRSGGGTRGGFGGGGRGGFGGAMQHGGRSWNGGSMQHGGRSWNGGSVQNGGRSWNGGSVQHGGRNYGGRNWNGGSGRYAGRNWNGGSGRYAGRNWNGGGGNRYRYANRYCGGYYGGYGYGFYPYVWGWPYYGASAALYYDGYGYGYGDGRVYEGRAVNSDGDSVVAGVQQELARAGFYRGTIDGVIGNETRNAVRAYERRNGLRVDGRIDGELLESMGLS